MIEVVLVANYQPEGSRIPRGSFSKLCERTYYPFLQAFEDCVVPVTHCISGHGLELFKSNHDDSFLERLQKGARSGMCEIATKGMSDAFFSYLPEDDVLEQLVQGREIQKELLGVSCHGFFPAEGWIDVFVVNALRKKEFDWAIVSPDFFDLGLEESSNLFCLKGIEQQRLPVFCVFQSERNVLAGIFEGKTDVKGFVNQIFQQFDKYKNPVLTFQLDMELPFFLENPNSAVKRFQFFLQCLQNAGSFHFALPSSLLQRSIPSEREIYPNVPYQRRLDILLGEARNALQKAQQKDPHSVTVRKAWRQLLLAEHFAALDVFISKDPSQKPPVYGNFERYLEGCERASEAKKIANERNDE